MCDQNAQFTHSNQRYSTLLHFCRQTDFLPSVIFVFIILQVTFRRWLIKLNSDKKNSSVQYASQFYENWTHTVCSLHVADAGSLPYFVSRIFWFL